MSKVNPHTPFKGLRFLELGRVFARPMAGSFFPKEGATVIKVKHPTLRDIISSLKFQYKIKKPKYLM